MIALRRLQTSFNVSSGTAQYNDGCNPVVECNAYRIEKELKACTEHWPPGSVAFWDSALDESSTSPAKVIQKTCGTVELLAFGGLPAGHFLSIQYEYN